jgi:hypothetical protein
MVKKIALILLLVTVLGGLAAAQESESHMYARTVFIERIYPSTDGYRIDYRRSNSIYMASAYIPIDWFGGPGADARLVFSDDRAAPFMTVYWLDGEFHHLVLVVRRERGHISWGPHLDADLYASRFESADTEFEL